MDDIYSLTRLYDEQHRDFTEDFAMYRTLASEYGSDVLELGAGNARVGLDLARAGHRVYGIDLSPDMVAFAEEKAASLGLQARLRVADMRSFDARTLFGLDKGFDLVICPFNTLCHLLQSSELLACLESVRNALKPGGVFAPSIFVPDPGYLYRDSNALYAIDEFWSDSRKQSVEIYGRNDYNPITQINKLDWFFSVDDEMIERSFELRMYYPQELRQLIVSAGFEIVEEWSDYETRLRGEHARTEKIPRDTVAQTIVCRAGV